MLAGYIFFFLINNNSSSIMLLFILFVRIDLHEDHELQDILGIQVLVFPQTTWASERIIFVSCRR